MRDMWALELGMPVPGLQFDGPTWTDVFPLSEAEELRASGMVVWERATAGPDRLDFHLTSEPLEVAAEAADTVAARVGTSPAVERVEADVQRLWKNGEEQHAEARFFVEFSERRPDDFDLIGRAIAEAGIESERSSISATPPAGADTRTVVLYAR